MKRQRTEQREARGRDLEARRTQRLRTGEVLRSGRTSLQVITLAAEACTLHEEATRRAQAEEPPRASAACREGCAWCCYRPVGVAAPEVFRIVAHLRQHATPEELQELLQRLAQRRPGSRAVGPCPLLVNERCSVYAVRPLTCRGFNSADAALCERSLSKGRQTSVPTYFPQLRLATFVLDGLRAGLQENRLDGELLDLAAALHTALTLPDAEKRWLAGERVFVAARLP